MQLVTDSDFHEQLRLAHDHILKIKAMAKDSI